MRSAVGVILISWLFFAGWKDQIATATPVQTGTNKIKVDTLNLGDSHVLPLAVWNKEIESGTKDVKLKSFDLVVRAYHLPDATHLSNNLKNLPAPTTGRWFRVYNNIAKYYNNWNGLQNTGEEKSVYMQENQQKLVCNGITISSLLTGDAFASLEIHSQISMSRNDLVFIGEFQFQPNEPGLYRLIWQVTRNHKITDTLNQNVYFKCPDYKLTLRAQNNKLLHHISYDRFGIPLVTSAFFEAGSEIMSANEPDRIFRNTFIAAVAKRMTCGKYWGELPILYDKIAKERPEIGKARAEKLQAQLEMMTGALHDGKACETAFTVRPATPDEWERFTKPRSEISPEQFSQENRVAPLVLDLAAQRQVFAPLEVLSNEKSDDVVLTVEMQPQRSIDECIRRGWIVVTEENSGQKQEEELPRTDLLKILRGEQKILLKSPAMLGFLRQGDYTAQVRLAVDCPGREIPSNTVTFFIERRLNVMRDEIFALNRYDKPVFAYALDHERVNNLAAAILQAAQDTLLQNPALQPPDALVLISGHACMLGEVVSRFYNLGLSFSRALLLRKALIDSIRQLGPKYGIEVRTGAEFCAAKPLITKFIDNPEINSLLNECLQASDGKALEKSYEDYLQRIIREKVRHFEAPSANWRSRPQGAPDSAQIRQRIEEIKHVLPGSVLTLALKRGGKTVNVHFVAVGFGAAVPFYRHFTMPAEMHEVFAKLGSPAPDSFYGDDRYPAGRLMNRRVEVNLIW
jgi:hypothetical protein